LPAMSPTVGFICAKAIRMDRILREAGRPATAGRQIGVCWMGIKKGRPLGWKG